MNAGITDASRLELLLDAGITIGSGLDLEAVLTRLVELACRVTDAQYGALGVIDQSGNRLDRFITHGLDQETRRAIGAEPIGRGILGVLISDARPLRLTNIQADPRSAGFPPNHPPMTSFLGVPVVAGDSVFGNLYLTEKDGGEFTETDERLASTLAAQAGVAIQNARLYADAQEHLLALERAVSELSSVREVNDAIVSGQPQRHVLELVAAAGLCRSARPVGDGRPGAPGRHHPAHRGRKRRAGGGGGRPRVSDGRLEVGDRATRPPSRSGSLTCGQIRTSIGLRRT